MIIALDYDATYTADKELWNKFIVSAQAHGHKIYVVTLRYPQEKFEVENDLRDRADELFFTGRQAKKEFMLQRGITPHIWIDDKPDYIINHHRTFSPTSPIITLDPVIEV